MTDPSMMVYEELEAKHQRIEESLIDMALHGPGVGTDTWRASVERERALREERLRRALTREGGESA